MFVKDYCQSCIYTQRFREYFLGIGIFGTSNIRVLAIPYKRVLIYCTCIIILIFFFHRKIKKQEHNAEPMLHICLLNTLL